MSARFPSTDSGLLAWSLNFGTLIAAGPVPLGLTALQATAYNALHTTYATALGLCDPGTRSKANVAAKNLARQNLKASARQLASIIDGQETVTDATRIELGITVRATPSSIAAPAFAPAVDIVTVNGRNVNIRVHDSQEARRGRPPYVQGCAIFSFVGAEPPADPSDWQPEGLTSKTLFSISFPLSVPVGAQVWITAQWYNAKSQTGPAAPPITTFLQGGVSAEAA